MSGERPGTGGNVTGCHDVTSPQKAEISPLQRGEACDKNAWEEGRVMDLHNFRPRGIILAETQVHVRPQPVRLKKYYLEVKMKHLGFGI